MRWVFEAGDIQDERHILSSVVATDWGEMPGSGLQQRTWHTYMRLMGDDELNRPTFCAYVNSNLNPKYHRNESVRSHLFEMPPIVGSDEMAIRRGSAADEVAAEVIDGDLVGAEGLDLSAGAVREAGDLAEGDAVSFDRIEGLAAVEHGLIEPAPVRPLPLAPAARVDGERVEDDGEGGEAAEGRLRLRLEAGGEAEEALHGARRQGLREEALAVRRGEVHRRRRRERPPVQGRRRRRHSPPSPRLLAGCGWMIDRSGLSVEAALIRSRPCTHTTEAADANLNSYSEFSKKKKIRIRWPYSLFFISISV